MNDGGLTPRQQYDRHCGQVGFKLITLYSISAKTLTGDPFSPGDPGGPYGP